MKQFDCVKGRQIVHLLLQNFKTFDNSEIVFGFDHLASIVCGVDLHAFLSQWTKILENMSGELSNKSLRDVFYRKIQGHKDLEMGINIYNRMRDGHEENRTSG